MTLVLQSFISLFAGFGVFLLWRRVSSASRPVFWLVTFGFLVRAIGGQLAFWISYLALPFARSLQLGNGLWIFALDATKYFVRASEAASSGPAAILFMTKSEASVVFIQILATALYAFGSVVSVAILLNVTAYLLCCLAVLSFGDATRDRAVVYGVAAISLSPSAIVWATQPLKDTTFIFLVAAFFAAARLWQRTWRDPDGSRPFARAALWTLALLALLYAIAGIRWYFGLVMWLAAFPFAALTVIAARRRIPAAASATVLLLLLGLSFYSSAGPYVPAHGDFLRPSAVIRTFKNTRAGFDESSGSTMIGVGNAFQKVDTRLGRTGKRVHGTRVEDVMATHSTEVERAWPKGLKHPKGARNPSTRQTTTAVQPDQAVAAPNGTATAATPSAVSAPHGRVPAARTTTDPTVIASSPTPAIQGTEGLAEDTTTPDAPDLEVEGGTEHGAGFVPTSHLARLLAGTIAVILPHSIAQPLGLLDIRGGRGLWLFAETDTVFFDLVLVVALVAVIRAVREHRLREPVFWFVLIVTLSIGLALAYTVSNFGTLFRHRAMVTLGIALLPLSLLVEEEAQDGLKAGPARHDRVPQEGWADA